MKKDVKRELKNAVRNGLMIVVVKKNVFELKKKQLLVKQKKIVLKLNVKLKWIVNVK